MWCRLRVNRVPEFVAKKLISAIIAISVVSACSVTASANSKYAAIVVDGNTGRVLHASNADAPRYPASLTKIMTLYILFDYLKKGRLSDKTKFYVTPHAAAQAPSKLGLKAGSYIMVKDIIGALVTKSANDAAAAVAENIAGSEAKFARLMTRKARALGMNNTVYKNASGLPNRLQRTTARDMAKLSMRIMNDFPRYAKAFKTRRFRYRGRSYRNHNGLLFSYRGTEGIKTGYTRASGFNLTSSVKRGNRHLIAVVMGGRSARSRNAEMRRLLNRYFPKAVAMTRKKPLAVRMASMDPAAARSRIRYTSAVTTSTSWKKRQPEGASIIKTSLASRSFGIGQFTGSSTRKGYDIQIGAYEDRNIAVGKLTKTRAEASDILNGHQPYIMRFSKNGVNYHRARFAGFSSRSGAANTCEQLKRKMKLSCIVMIP